MTITGNATRVSNQGIVTINYNILDISLDRDDIQNLRSLIDAEQINRACFTFVQTLFPDKPEDDLKLVPVDAFSNAAPFFAN